MTPGQRDYEADVARCPLYHDGSPRPKWDRLSAIAQISWELPEWQSHTGERRSPTPDAESVL